MWSLPGLTSLVASVLVLGLESGVVAQSSTSTSSAAQVTHTVAAGADGFVYTPNQITANVGDIVSFHFYPQNHSVARAAYKQSCIPYEDTGINLVGFWSGFEPVAVVLSDPPTFNLLINDTEPIFFYCSAPGACQDGMVGVINANATQTFEVQLAYAKNSSVEFSPGEYFPAETSSGTSSSTATATATATSSSSSGSGSKAKSGLSSGAIAGIAVGGTVGILLAGLVLYLCGRQKTMNEFIRNTPSGAGNRTLNPNNHNSMMVEAQYANAAIKSPTPTSTASPDLVPSEARPFSPENMNPAWGYGYGDHHSSLPGSSPPPGYTSPTFQNRNSRAPSELGTPLQGSGMMERAMGERPQMQMNEELHELGDSSLPAPGSADRRFSFAEGNSGYVQTPKREP